jgi:hypothetical protein
MKSFLLAFSLLLASLFGAHSPTPPAPTIATAAVADSLPYSPALAITSPVSPATMIAAPLADAGTSTLQVLSQAAPTDGSYVTQAELADQVTALRALISQLTPTTTTAFTDPQIAANGNGALYGAVAAPVQQLSSITITSPTFSGTVSGLTASEIPDLSGTYLPLTGGTLSGLFGASNASTSELSVFNDAWFGVTATSSFNSAGVLTLASPLAIPSGGTGTSTTPSYGQLLLGNGSGGYNLVGTSSLGISGGASLTGSAGQIAYFTGTNSAIGTSSLFIAPDGNAGIASTSPWAKFSVDSTNVPANAPILAIGSSAANYLVVTNSGAVGIGTTSPPGGTLLDVDTPTTTGPGTITVSASGTTVTGTGTNFLSAFMVGDTITANGETHTISTISSNTTMTTDAWTSSASNAAYTVAGATRLFVEQNGDVTIGGGLGPINGSPRLLAINRTFSNASPTGLSETLTVNNTTFTNASPTGASINLSIGASTTQNLGTVTGIFANAAVASGASSTITQIKGMDLRYGNSASNVSMTSMAGLSVFNQTGNAGTVSNLTGINVTSGNTTGTTTTASGIAISAPTKTGSGIITNSEGLQINNQNAGTNNVDILYGSSVAPTGNYGIYQQDGYPNYFGGSTDIGGAKNPYSQLQVTGLDSASSTSAFAVVNSASTTVFSVFDGGNAELSGSLSQSSDQRLKTNIESLDASSSLSLIDQLNPVTFDWIDPDQGTTPQSGFIAQQVQQVFPNLVSTTSPTALTPDGTLGLNYIGLIAPIVKAAQAIYADVLSLEQTVSGFAQSFTTNKLCLSDANGTSCYTRSQIDAALASLGQSTFQSANQSATTAPQSQSDTTTTSASVTQNATNTPPTITINGDNPSIIQVGADYSDGHSLDVATFLNGVPAPTLTIDTSAPATDTIDYVATDSSGHTSTSTRTIIIETPTTMATTSNQ